MSIKKILRFLKQRLIISVFIGIALFVGFIALVKLPFRKNTDLYVTVKLSQGFWWANTQKPGIWFLEALKKGDKEPDLLGKTLAEIVSVRYYQQMNLELNQFDIYLTVKLNAQDNGDRGYIFKRSTIAIGSPLDLNFKNSQVAGTIIKLSKKLNKLNYIEKTIVLTKKFAFPWEFDAIKIGDKYFDGEETLFEITDKQAIDTSVLSSDAYGNLSPQTEDQRKYIVVTGKIKLKQNSFNQFIFGEEQVIKVNSYANLTTNNMILNDFFVAGLN